MSAALQLLFTLLWWIGLAVLAASLGVIAIAVYGTIVDRRRKRQQRKQVRPPLLVECERRARRRGLGSWDAFVEGWEWEHTARDVRALPEVSERTVRR